MFTFNHAKVGAIQQNYQKNKINTGYQSVTQENNEKDTSKNDFYARQKFSA